MEEIKEKLRAASDIRLLEHCPFVLLKKGNRVRTIADEIFEDAQMSPRIVLETENIETVLALSGKVWESPLSQDVHVPGPCLPIPTAARSWSRTT